MILGQLMQDVGCGRDGVGAEEELQSGQLRCRNEAVGQGRIAGDVPVLAGGHLCRCDLVLDGEGLGGLAEGPARLESGKVGGEDLWLGGELGRQEGAGAIRGPGVQPGQQPEGVHVLGALGLLLREVELLEGLDGL